MLTFVDVPEWLAARHREAQALGQRLLSTFSELGEPVMVLGEGAFEEIVDDDHVALVVEGVVRAAQNGGLVRFYAEGDVILHATPGMTVTAEFATKAIVCARTGLFARVRSDPDFAESWLTMVEHEAAITHALSGLYVRPDIQPPVRIEQYAAGDTIIEEGAMSQDIYVMLDGEARVDFEGRTVGSVGANEMFGEMSFLLGRPRMATVIAARDCVVHRVPGEEFGLLLAVRPTLAIDLARTMAWRIARLNPRAEAA